MQSVCRHSLERAYFVIPEDAVALVERDQQATVLAGNAGKLPEDDCVPFPLRGVIKKMLVG